MKSPSPKTSDMPRLILFNKPYGVLCQFSDDASGKPTLAQYVGVPGVYPTVPTIFLTIDRRPEFAPGANLVCRQPSR